MKNLQATFHEFITWLRLFAARFALRETKSNQDLKSS